MFVSHTIMNEPFQTASVIDASPVKFTRMTERFVSEVFAVFSFVT